MSQFRRCSITPILAASLCIALTACEPNSVPAEPQRQASSAPAAAEAAPAPELKKLDMAARSVDLTPSKLCNLETLDGGKPAAEPTVPKDPAAVAFSGWVGDETTGKRPTDARLRFATPNHHQIWEWDLGAPVARKDVSRYVNIPTLEDAGFRTTVDLTPLPQGEYRVYVVFNGPNGAYRCDNGRRILR